MAVGPYSGDMRYVPPSPGPNHTPAHICVTQFEPQVLHRAALTDFERWAPLVRARMRDMEATFIEVQGESAVAVSLNVHASWRF